MENVSSQEQPYEKPRAQNFFHVIECKTKETDWHPLKFFFAYKTAMQILAMERKLNTDCKYRYAKYVRSAQIE